MEAPASGPVRVLLVDDDARAVDHMRDVLSPRFRCESASTGEAGLSAFDALPFEVVVSSSALKGNLSAFDLLDGIHLLSPQTRFILMGGGGTLSDVMEAGKRGASDYLVRPFDDAALARIVDRAANELQGRRLSTGDGVGWSPSPQPGSIIGTSAGLLDALDAADRVAFSTAPVLLMGETGTGKDLLAARIHARGSRRHRPFVVVNAAAIRSNQLDSELFGHIAGSFSGATRARRGLLVEADTGTIFLDEIADLPVELQGRLLRVLETGAIRPVGADHERKVDVRFIATTKGDLAEAVRLRGFREDLYFRLNVLAIRVPPLRERPDDIPSLIDYFFEISKVRNPRSPVRDLTLSARERLAERPWRGNVRELLCVVERLVVLGKTTSIDEGDLEPVEGTKSDPPEGALPAGGLSDPSTLRDMTARYVDSVLTSTGGDKARAASILGIDVSTLYRWRRRRRA